MVITIIATRLGIDGDAGYWLEFWSSLALSSSLLSCMFFLLTLVSLEQGLIWVADSVVLAAAAVIEDTDNQHQWPRSNRLGGIIKGTTTSNMVHHRDPHRLMVMRGMTGIMDNRVEWLSLRIRINHKGDDFMSTGEEVTDENVYVGLGTGLGVMCILVNDKRISTFQTSGFVEYEAVGRAYRCGQHGDQWGQTSHPPVAQFGTNEVNLVTTLRRLLQGKQWIWLRGGELSIRASMVSGNDTLLISTHIQKVQGAQFWTQDRISTTYRPNPETSGTSASRSRSQHSAEWYSLRCR